MMSLGTCLRVIAIGGAVVVSAASAKRPNTGAKYAGSGNEPPQAHAMAPSAAVGLWKSTFGPVKIELDEQHGPGQVRGIWYYKRDDEEVIGDFAGQLRGNVLRFKWREPAKPSNLTGTGYLVFDQRGQRFNGKWWTNNKDRTGTWTGWRQRSNAQPVPRQPDPNDPDGANPDNGSEPPPPPPDDGTDTRPPPPPEPPANGGGAKPYPAGTTLPPM